MSNCTTRGKRKPRGSGRSRRVALSFLCLALVAASGAVVAGALEALFAPKARLWEFWSAHDPADTRQIDHGDWDRFLRAWVVEGQDGINRVRYADAAEAGRAAVEDYIRHLTAVPIRGYSRPEQLAYWINLYNALTVQVVLEHYPVRSIREIDISPGLFADGPWGSKLVTIEGQGVSLNDIEHRILRPVWRDPRIHYAVNCASLGCPDLQPRAFTGDGLEPMLDEAARAFVNHPRGVRVQDGRLHVSSIYSWFRGDFGRSNADLITHFRQYAEPALKARLEGLTRISGDDYDWSLNDAAVVGDGG